MKAIKVKEVKQMPIFWPNKAIFCKKLLHVILTKKCTQDCKTNGHHLILITFKPIAEYLKATPRLYFDSKYKYYKL